LVISATDSWGNKATESFTFTVLDSVAPVITGPTTATYTAGDAAPDWASLVTVNEGTLTVNTSQVDMTSAGTFYVTITATDASGNSSQHTITVTIEAAEEVETGCFSSINLASSLVILIAGLGGAVLYFSRKK